MDMNDEKLSESMEFHLRKMGANRYSPIFSTDQEYEDIAYEVAEIINRTHRRVLSFLEFADNISPDFIPECNDDNVYLDTGTHVKQRGRLEYQNVLNIKETKKICARCPIRKECLAVSMTELQRSRSSNDDEIIPKIREDSDALVLSEYLIFGGYTPQERQIIFDKVREILQEYDRSMNDK